ncbi:MAG: hypothetical protein UR25_C0004G0004 [Candidatus Nomurabacteria bacterium GW2011_GWE1_32_28]|uniref:DUF5671 domain-containing protein n=1 Tax=Candidatus Nomurabacteria bacterium GW2011_GWF1_31_48 TaxID=1618767 RepID=A0A0G0AU39_9BACT|nr:MAG: hypothetical protein UR10_C0004G0003 [Candidatus Nomurabacteria bacterium GW2011_GWF2_30_133]KKP28500.1 MAG: hypothetical protein UR18_C0003G0003 [Candidatus Nomurabacteria bacterium GW2011_GWE2_31_40]KKP30095.1 MAG: hypothetical protein UR19_C0004G0003 [Candidatus Nomurabacteria bacterium GW2011_GWF1_31_48]KKP34640.1 MAG: hypothetical protein UR25_C0004G0004 [Candidatus Nomurabacteria bacterium GW2011_GWE1_32_28]HAS80898.1 hypothetical protein [Candidatus Nomurabacteria bacterium]
METNKPKLNIGFFFLCLGLLITLVTSVVSFLSLVFGTLNKKFPDILNSIYQYGYSTYDYESIRSSLATLIIFFPIFFVISYFWRKFTEGEMGYFDEIIRKWVTYIILFLSSIVMAIDLVVLVRYFISGETTIRFIYKVLSVFLVAILIGVYHYILIKTPKEKHKVSSIIFGFISIVLVIASIFYSFVIMGSPKTQRLFRLDDKRINDLQSIQWQVINYWQQKEKLPEKLIDLSNPMTGYSLPVDPEFQNGSTYEYFVKDKLSFEICATFVMPMPQGWRESGAYYGGVTPISVYEKDISTSSYPYKGGVNESWNHEVGRTCFERIIDEDIYPPFEKNVIK